MLVKELIKELQKRDQDMEIRIDRGQYMAPITEVTRDMYYTDSDGEWCCVHPEDLAVPVKKKIIIVLRYQ